MTQSHLPGCENNASAARDKFVVFVVWCLCVFSGIICVNSGVPFSLLGLDQIIRGHIQYDDV